MGIGAGLYMYVLGVQKFTFAILSPDEFLYFHPVVCSIFLSFFPRLSSAAADWMSAILPHMVWP